MRYKLELSEEQAEITKIALEEYFRLRMNQTYDFVNSICFEGDEKTELDFDSQIDYRDMFKNEFEKLLNMFHPLRLKGGKFREKTIGMRRAMDIWQVIRYRLMNEDMVLPGLKGNDMGLDIRAFKGLKEAENPKYDEYGEVLNWETQWKPGCSMEWSESVWPGKGKPLSPQCVYEWEEIFEFRAGSYCGYNWWRDKLDEFAGNVAFQELIDFADNEGVIGSELSEKLYEDFRKYHNKAEEYSKTISDGEWWLEMYYDWEKAFEMAKEGGAVEFW